MAQVVLRYVIGNPYPYSIYVEFVHILLMKVHTIVSWPNHHIPLQSTDMRQEPELCFTLQPAWLRKEATHFQRLVAFKVSYIPSRIKEGLYLTLGLISVRSECCLDWRLTQQKVWCCFTMAMRAQLPYERNRHVIERTALHSGDLLSG